MGRISQLRRVIENSNPLQGGVGDTSKSSDFDPEQIKMGLKVEMEHTDDEDVAMDIVKDHLTEDPQYYTKLASVEKD